MTGDSLTSSATATQNSSIAATGFSGTASATATAELSGVIADSTSAGANYSFSSTFTVNAATMIDLSGQLDTTGDANSSVAFDTFVQSSAGSSNPTQPFDFAETLQPGHSYTLTFSGGIQTGASIETGDVDEDAGTGSADFSFTLATVPEPASSTLLLLAAPALASRRRWFGRTGRGR
jgi:hypothetical protein